MRRQYPSKRWLTSQWVTAFSHNDYVTIKPRRLVLWWTITAAALGYPGVAPRQELSNGVIVSNVHAHVVFVEQEKRHILRLVGLERATCRYVRK